MVDWHPFNEFPPKNREQWTAEFEKYQQFPEFKMRNSDISMQDFKWIWYMEYIHRSFGRLIGLSFFVPAAYFGYKGYFKGRVKHVIAGLGALILFQGGLGWYMVKSGLEDKQYEVYYGEPRVSHLRLASHLGTAFLFFSATTLAAMHHLLPPERLARTAKLLTLKRCAYGLTGAVFTTALSGALVAGMEAGLVYNSWPKMADRWIPEDLLRVSPMWKNFIENSTTVQFDHRWLGQLTFALASGTWLYSRRLPLTPQLRLASNLVMLIACFQLSLGVSTLLLYVPKHLAATHQAGALALLTSSLYLSHQLKMIPKI
jgi:cytochrome c oxidase assembly protein subunit 15